MQSKEGDTVGVYVTAGGELHFTKNNIDQGTAWTGLPTDQPLYVVINLYKTPVTISMSHTGIMGKYVRSLFKGYEIVEAKLEVKKF